MASFREDVCQYIDKAILVLHLGKFILNLPFLFDRIQPVPLVLSSGNLFLSFPHIDHVLPLFVDLFEDGGCEVNSCAWSHRLTLRKIHQRLPALF